LRRDIEVLSDCVLSTCIDRSLIPPFGLYGGGDGAANLIYLMRKGSDAWESVNPRLSNLPLKAGDTVRIETAIGGGFGDPLERDPKLVTADVFDGYLTKEDAEAVYGVILSDDLSADEAATARSRREFRERRAHDGQPEASYPKREPSFTPAGGQAA
jgi:N-methylhydantoinase B